MKNPDLTRAETSKLTSELLQGLSPRGLDQFRNLMLGLSIAGDIFRKHLFNAIENEILKEEEHRAGRT